MTDQRPVLLDLAIIERILAGKTTPEDAATIEGACRKAKECATPAPLYEIWGQHKGEYVWSKLPMVRADELERIKGAAQMSFDRLRVYRWTAQKWEEWGR